MATAVVYTISNETDKIVDQFECDYNYAIGEYHNKQNSNGRYYIARKGVKIPFPEKERVLKRIFPSQDQEQSP